MVHVWFAAACACVLGCGGARVVVESVQFGAPTAPPSLAVPTAHTDGLEAADVSAITTGHALAAAVVGSAGFAQQLARIANLASKTGGATSPGTVIGATYGQAVDVCYRVDHRCGGTTAETGLGTCGDATGGIVTLYDATVERLRSADLEGRACAINTLAHEWTHAHAVAGAFAFTDDKHLRATRPLVSYTVGALAQCLFLQAEYAQRPELHGAAFAIERCVEAVGTTTFDLASCASGWGRQFLRQEAPLW